MMYSVKALLSIMTLMRYFAVDAICADVSWPTGCLCQDQVDHTHAVKCAVTDLEPTVSQLPTSVTRLLILLRTGGHELQQLDICHLTELREFGLDGHSIEALDYFHRVTMSISICLNNSRLAVFRSRVDLQWRSSSQFLHMNHLKELTLSFTYMMWQDMAKLAEDSLKNKVHLEKLILRGFNRRDGPQVIEQFNLSDTLGSLTNIRLKHLDLANNGFHYIAQLNAALLHHIEYLDLSYNMLCYKTKPLQQTRSQIYALILMYNLSTLNVGHQGVYEPYQPTLTLEQEEVTLAPTDNKLPLDQSKQCAPGPEQPSCQCGLFPIPIGRLETLIFPAFFPFVSKNTIRLKDISCICISLPNRLKYLDIQDNAGLFGYDPFAGNTTIVNLNCLETLNIQNQGATHFSNTFFSSFSALKVALLGRNKLRSLFIDGIFYFWSNAQLQVLDLADNEMEEFPSGDVLRALPGLMHLNLSGNAISTWNTSISMLHQLRTLNLSNNRLATLPAAMRSELDVLVSSPGASQLSIDLRSNHLSCLCDNIPFVEWMKTTNITFSNIEQHTCVHPVSGLTQAFKVDTTMLTQHCFPNTMRLVATSVTVTSLSTLVIVALITAYCKRWYFRYWWYLLHSSWRRHRQVEEGYEYDAFIAHSKDNEEWVIEEMIEELETKRGLRLCLYQRDIYPNEILIEALVDRIDKSRNTLLVLSPSFVASHWCRLEMDIAHTKMGEEGKDVIVSVLLESLPCHSINETLHKLLRRKVYIEWPSKSDGRLLFWERLATALRVSDRRNTPEGQSESDGRIFSIGDSDDVTPESDAATAIGIANSPSRNVFSDDIMILS